MESERVGRPAYEARKARNHGRRATLFHQPHRGDRPVKGTQYHGLERNPRRRHPRLSERRADRKS